jgi:hypothetical protein
VSHPPSKHQQDFCCLNKDYYWIFCHFNYKFLYRINNGLVNNYKGLELFHIWHFLQILFAGILSPSGLQTEGRRMLTEGSLVEHRPVLPEDSLPASISENTAIGRVIWNAVSGSSEKKNQNKTCWATQWQMIFTPQIPFPETITSWIISNFN